MSLHLYDTATRQLRAFEPLEPGRVSIYLCGATVQAAPHIGHIRSGLCFDVLGRWLRVQGLEVTFCRNVTDIDDKILARGQREERPWWAVAYEFERAFNTAYDLLGCAPPTVEPRATGHIPEMITLMQELIDAGHAYAVDGDVYFEVHSFPQYGALSGQDVADMLPATDSVASGKKDPRDFALWKGAKPGEPFWETPWGPGRPGWHLECSAMAGKYLGDTFDIHGGGRDLIFPHHENEIAQSQAAGRGFANYWMHNGWVTTAGEKMSKSLGNSLLVTAVVQQVRPIELRYYLIAGHYRSNIEFSFDALAETARGFRRIEAFLERAEHDASGNLAEQVAQLSALPWAEQVAAVTHPDMRAQLENFAAALNDDLGTPQALGILHDTVRAGNAALTASDVALSQAAVLAAALMAEVLGVNPLAPFWREHGGQAQAQAEQTLDALIQLQLAERAQARAEKNWARADEIRDQLTQLGIEIKDSAEGASWTLSASETAGQE